MNRCFDVVEQILQDLRTKPYRVPIACLHIVPPRAMGNVIAADNASNPAMLRNLVVHGKDCIQLLTRTRLAQTTVAPALTHGIFLGASINPNFRVTAGSTISSPALILPRPRSIISGRGLLRSPIRTSIPARAERPALSAARQLVQPEALCRQWRREIRLASTLTIHTYLLR